MKRILLLPILSLAILGLPSCCSLFGSHSQSAGYRTETKQVRACGYDTVTKEVLVPGSGKGGMVQTIEEKVPRYKTVTKKTKIRCGSCVRLFCPKKDCCGTTSSSTLLLASAQGPVGSPHIGLVPTMKPLAP